MTSIPTYRSPYVQTSADLITATLHPSGTKMILVTGSHALNQVQFVREPADLDLVMTLDTLHKSKLAVFPKDQNHFIGELEGKPLEVTIAWPNSTDEELLNIHAAKPSNTLYGLEVVYASLDWLYALKMSHRFKKDSPHFLKTLEDIHLMRSIGVVIPDMSWFKRRQKETLAKHPKLNQSKKDFFNTPGVTYVYDHDSIHRAMALGDRPAYLEYKGDTEDVWCDKSKWDNLPDSIKLNGVIEEALVLALERSQIPFDFKPGQTWSFRIALMKVCTSITSGWFREWAWEHYGEAIDRFDDLPFNYVDQFHQKLEAGIVRKL